MKSDYSDSVDELKALSNKYPHLTVTVSSHKCDIQVGEEPTLIDREDVKLMTSNMFNLAGKMIPPCKPLVFYNGSVNNYASTI